MQYALHGLSVAFKCHSDELSNWLFNNGPLPEDVEVTPDNVLRIKSVNIGHAGYYECDKVGPHIRSVGRLKIIGKKWLSLYVMG